MPEYEYQHQTAAGIVRIRREADGLWHAYLGDQKWVGDFTLPDYAIDSLAMVEHRFPDGINRVGNSTTLELSDNLSHWRKVKVT